MWLIPDRDAQLDELASESLDWETIGRMVRLRTLKAVTAHFALLAALADETEPGADCVSGVAHE